MLSPSNGGRRMCFGIPSAPRSVPASNAEARVRPAAQWAVHHFYDCGRVVSVGKVGLHPSLGGAVQRGRLTTTSAATAP